MAMLRDEPDVDDVEDVAEAQRQDDAFQRQYENEHTWEALQEDEHGNLRVDTTLEARAKRRRTLLSAAQSARLRKGMIRYTLLVLDASAASAQSDLRPSRLTVMTRIARDFVRNYFDQNPLSQLGVLVMRNGVVERLTDISGSPEAQVRRLESAALLNAEGSVSLQNAVDAGVALLSHIPPYGQREMLVLLSALSTCDPGSIFDSIKAAKEARVRVSVVGVAAEVYVCRKLATDTGGTYGVGLNEGHLEELMAAHAPPPLLTASSTAGSTAGRTAGPSTAQLVRMGFPQKSADAPASAVFVGAEARLLAGSYTCPRCAARCAELPSECHVCGLTLISSPHLARSYHHLFPIPPYREVPPEEVSDLADARAGCAGSSGSGAEVPYALYCHACLRDLSPGGAVAGAVAAAAVPMVLQCGGCSNLYCYECDAYVHESLHNCPGCEMRGQQAGGARGANGVGQHGDGMDVDGGG